MKRYDTVSSCFSYWLVSKTISRHGLFYDYENRSVSAVSFVRTNISPFNHGLNSAKLSRTLGCLFASVNLSFVMRTTYITFLGVFE